MSSPEVLVGGIAVRPFKSMVEALNFILDDGRVITGSAIAINPEKVVLAQTDMELKNAIANATLRFADGIGVVNTIRRKGVKSARIPGCELWQQLMLKSAEYNTPVMLLGAKPEVNRIVVEKLRSESVNIVYACDGYSLDENELITAIHRTKPKIISIALGSPKQEKLIERLQKIYPEAFYQGVGGSFDVYAGSVKRAPKWALKLYLEWFYRLCRQPSRAFRQRNLIKYLMADFRGKL